MTEDYKNLGMLADHKMTSYCQTHEVVYKDNIILACIKEGISSTIRET